MADLLIDVIRRGARPGSLIRLEREEIPRHLHHKVSPHQIDLGEVFALAELRGTFPSRAVALGIEPADVELHHGLSPEVESTIPELVAAEVMSPVNIEQGFLGVYLTHQPVEVLDVDLVPSRFQ